jgi:transcriptional regulator with XRE-family HTH domain
MVGDEYVTGAQIRAGRALLDLSAEKLAEKTTLSRGTIQRAELETAEVTASNMARIVETLKALGIIFIPANGEDVGVRLKKKRPKMKS